MPTTRPRRRTIQRLAAVPLAVVTLTGVGACGRATSGSPRSAGATAVDLGVPTTPAASPASGPSTSGSPAIVPSSTGAAVAGGRALPTVLAMDAGRLAAVVPGGTAPRWVRDGAVAAPDGSAAYEVDRGRLARLDLASGSAATTWALPAGEAWRIAAVSPGGRTVALTDGPADRDHRRATTRIVIVDTADGAERDRTLPGTLEPEAISPTGTIVYVLDHRDTYYRVRSLDVTTGELADTFGRDKSPAEDMNGSPIRAVLAPGGNTLATLYREPTGTKPFVHVLHLDYGWTYCADLPAGSYDRIAGTADGRTLFVGRPDGTWLSIDLAAFTEAGSEPLAIDEHPGESPPVQLTPQGTLTADDLVVSADAGGVSWLREGEAPVHTTVAVDSLVALASA